MGGCFLFLLLIENVSEETTKRAGPSHLRTMRHKDDGMQSRKSEGGILCPSGQLAALGIGCTSRADLVVP